VTDLSDLLRSVGQRYTPFHLPFAHADEVSVRGQQISGQECGSGMCRRQRGSFPSDARDQGEGEEFQVVALNYAGPTKSQGDILDKQAPQSHAWLFLPFGSCCKAARTVAASPNADDDHSSRCRRSLPVAGRRLSSDGLLRSSSDVMVTPCGAVQAVQTRKR
jgi:hypothetical protein